jgi:class 3 adenylate cyclase/tetratricopeptide (TPR) repeat protein
MPEAVTCAKCEHSNPSTARFCMRCGAPLERACPACGVPAPAEAHFCMACGASLEAALAPPTPIRVTEATAPPLTAEERRTVTVLFADLSGYSSVAERLDPEEMKSVVDRCLGRLAEEVDRFGGRVDKYIGDAVMAIFGAPIAHPDDPERAVRAGLAMQAAMTELGPQLRDDHEIELPLRVGINTGEVLAGRVGDAYTVIGDAVNVASRLQAAGRTGCVTVGDRTMRATGGKISYRALAPLSLKGKTQPVAAWEALRVLDEEPGAEGERRVAGTFVGRREELAELERLFRRVVAAGSPHLVTVMGQPGVGKTRVLREFERVLSSGTPPVALRRGRCLQFGTSVVYWPLSELLRSECGIVEGDPPETAWSKLSDRFAPAFAGGPDGCEQLSSRLAPIARLLGAESVKETESSVEQDILSAREGFFGSVRFCLEAIADGAPTVIAWEDIHWADEGMLDLIEYLSEWLRAPVLQVCLAREELLERRRGWGSSRRGAGILFLDPLAPADARELVSSLLRDAGANQQLLGTLVDRAGGNPLFAEEMVQRLTEEEGARAAELPDTVRGVLAARIDSLPSLERALVAHAAVIGRTFWEAALAPVVAAEGGELTVALESLRRRDIIVPGESASLMGEQELAFKHVLIRDVAYSMLPKAVRAHKHGQVAAFIEQRAGERGQDVVALLAEHYGRAASLGEEIQLGEHELAPLRAKALRFAEAAGDAARDLYANEEALARYETAEVLAGVDPELAAAIRDKQGDVALRLGRVDSAISVWQQCLSHWDERGDVERVAELHRKIGAALAHKGERTQAIEHHQKGINLLKDAPPSVTLVRLYEEAASLYMQVGDNMLAIYAAEKALRLAERLGTLAAAGRAHGIFGRVFGRIGDHGKARENLERAVALAREAGDEGETVLALMALGHQFEHGEADYENAGRRYDDALTLAKRIGDVPAEIELQAALAQLAFYRCDWDEVAAAADMSAELAQREGLVGKLCLPYSLRGWLHWREGDFASSARLFRHAHELAEQLGWSEVAFNALLGLAVTLRDEGRLAEAESTLDQALELCDRAGLIAQSIQACAARTVLLRLAEDHAGADESAAQAISLAARVRYPIGQAAALEAQGAMGELPGALELLERARAAWSTLGRPIDAARCGLLFARRLREHDPAAAGDALRAAAEAYERVGVQHLAKEARQSAVV